MNRVLFTFSNIQFSKVKLRVHFIPYSSGEVSSLTFKAKPKVPSLNVQLIKREFILKEPFKKVIFIKVCKLVGSV